MSNLCDLLYHLRNAACHHNLAFSSDREDPQDVELIAKDRANKTVVYWIASISVADLEKFCRGLVDLMVENEAKLKTLANLD